ncbi:hypothetical protein LCGC14_2024270, partial [marine sediment metagenome]
EFLQDVKVRSEVVFLETGSREHSDLLVSAKKRGILIENSRDLGVIKTIYAFTERPNSNGDRLSSKEFQKVFPQIIGKPMDVGHNRQLIVGYYIDYKYILKENKAIAYAVFFKSSYPKLWMKALDFKKKNKLSSSFEIWSDNNKTIEHRDGTQTLRDLEIAGGALIFEEYGEVPAFKDAKVLDIAKKVNLNNYIDEKCLVYASKYKQEGIIVANDYFKDSVKENKQKLEAERLAEEEKLKKEKALPTKVEDKKVVEKSQEVTPEVKKDEVVDKDKKIEETPEDKKKDEPIVPKIKCSNCNHEWEVDSQQEYAMGSEKCPNCFAIIDQTGKMLYPPQIKDFNMACPGCSISNWLILSRNEENMSLKCQSCAKEYKIDFEVKKETIADKINFMYASYVRCPQCSNSVPYAGISSIKEADITCKKCGLYFSFDITREVNKKISKIEEIVHKVIEKSSERGGKDTMELKPNDKNDKDTVSKDSGMSKKVIKEEKVEVAPKTEEVVKEKVTPIEDKSITDSSEIIAKEKATDTETITTSTDKNIVKVDIIIEPKSVDKYAKSKTLRKAIVKIKDSNKELTTAIRKVELRKVSIKRLVDRIVKLKKEVVLYKANAKKIIARRNELGETDLIDVDILNDDKFNLAVAMKENVELKAKKLNTGSEVLGGKNHSEEDLKKQHDKIDREAFKHTRE